MVDGQLAAARQVRHGDIDDSIVPGTVLLVDIGHNTGKDKADGLEDVILVPEPSKDPGQYD